MLSLYVEFICRVYMSSLYVEFESRVYMSSFRVDFASRVIFIDKSRVILCYNY